MGNDLRESNNLLMDFLEAIFFVIKKKKVVRIIRKTKQFKREMEYVFFFIFGFLVF